MNPHTKEVSRRGFLVSAAATVGTAALSTPLSAQSSARFHRLNLSKPNFPARILDSYKKAIRAMLALPVTDPRNWYRIALTHTLDCPHGNWWFLPWHRAYIGWFEQVCRELSGDAEFALPYWDWTEEPRVPEALFDDVLTPSHPAYIGSYADFNKQFLDAVAKAGWWQKVWTANGEFDERTQYGQLLTRGLRFPEDLWFDINDDPRGTFFFDHKNARGLTRDNRELDERTKKSVALPMLLDALAPRDFLTFGSPKALAHSGLTGFGILEGQPHNRVHNNVGGISTTTIGGKPVRNNVGGFMQANLSPVDPLFFLHHSNIDRLWDLWTRKQQARGYPILPDGYPHQPAVPVREGSDYAAWLAEPFLFFTDAKGQPVAKTNAGDYASIGEFNYDYQTGSGEEIVTVPMISSFLPTPDVQRFSAQLVNASVSAAKSASAFVTLPAALLQIGSGPTAPRLFAKLTVAMPPFAHPGDLTVVLGTPGAGLSTSDDSITLSMFGHHLIHAPITFTVPLSGALASLRTRNLISATEPLNILVASEMPPPSSHTHTAIHTSTPRAEILAVTVEAH